MLEGREEEDIDGKNDEKEERYKYRDSEDRKKWKKVCTEIREKRSEEYERCI